METALAYSQGAFYLLTGIWPILSIGTFQAVTGPKTDLWLVKTVGAVIAVIGSALLHSAWSGEVTDSIAMLAAGSAVALATVDINYSLKGVISKIYLADAAVEIPLVILWLLR